MTGSETERYRHLTTQYCVGFGIDVGSQGDPVVPSAISFDLPEKEFLKYSGGQPPKGRIDVRGHAENLPFSAGTFDYLYSSHLLEDFYDWAPILIEWVRVVKIGGRIIILVPDRIRWWDAMAAGQPPNCQHRHEPVLGDLTKIMPRFGVQPIVEKYTDCFAGDYTIMFVGKRQK